MLEHLLDDTLEYFECSYAEHEQQARLGFTLLNLRDDMQSRLDNLTTLAPPGQENCIINHVGDTKLIINGEIHHSYIMGGLCAHSVHGGRQQSRH